jgi:excisionase family DNA binding protein
VTETQTASPLGLTVDEAARLLALPVEKVRELVARGLPVSADGRINLVQYAAWLNKEFARAD